MRIGLGPQAIGFDCLVILAGGVLIIMSGDIKFFPFTYALAAFESLFHVLNSQGALAQIAIDRAEPGVRDGEVWIEINRYLIQRDGLRFQILRALFIARRVSL